MKPSKPKIMKFVCDYFVVHQKELESESRRHIAVKARIFSMYFLRKYHNLPYQKIGRYYNRHHATVISSLDRINKNNWDPRIMEELKQVEEKLLAA